MSSRTVVGQAFLGLGAGLLFSNSQAAFIIDNETGLVSPDKIVIDFGTNLVPNGTTIDTQLAGVTFGPTYVYNKTGPDYPALTDGYLENANQLNEPGSILFSSDVTAANFSWRTERITQTTFSAYNDGFFVESFSAGTNVSLQHGRYFGFENIVFDEIRLTIAHGTKKQFTLDNLEYVSAIPVPAAVWLFGSGLLVLLGIARSKR